MKWIIQFVLKQLAKRSGKKTGITTLTKASDSIVRANTRNIEKTLQNMGVNINKLTSTDDVLKYMNINKSLMDQKLKQQAKALELDKGIASLGKKTTTTVDDRGRTWDFQGWTPKVVEGGGTSPDDFLKLKEDTYRRLMLNTDDAVKAFGRRILENKQDVKFEKLSKDQRKGIFDLIDDRIKLGNRNFMNKHNDLDVGFDPEDFASGGRASFAGGGAAWKFFMKFFEPAAIKTSNEIRQGLGKWAGLDWKQKMIQHDNFTKMVDKILKSENMTKR